MFRPRLPFPCIAWLWLALLGTLACAPDQALAPLPPKARAAIHVLHASARAGGPVDLWLQTQGSARSLADNLDFRQGWPSAGYASILVPGQTDSLGRQTLTLQVLKSAGKIPLIPQINLTVPQEAASSLILVDSFSKPILVRSIDQFPSLIGDSAAIRFMNLNFSVRSVTLQSKDRSMQVQSLNFLNFSSYRAYKTGLHTFYFINDQTRSIIDSLPGIRLQPQTLYNFYLANHNGMAVAGVETLKMP